MERSGEAQATEKLVTEYGESWETVRVFRSPDDSAAVIGLHVTGVRRYRDGRRRDERVTVSLDTVVRALREAGCTVSIEGASLGWRDYESTDGDGWPVDMLDTTK